MTAPSITIAHADLLAALSRAAGFLATKLAKHNLGQVWLDASAAGLALQATDATMDVTCHVEAVPGKPGEAFSCGVPGKQFLQLVQRLPEAPIGLSLDVAGGKLRVKSGRSNSGLPIGVMAMRPTLAMPPEVTHPIPGKRLAVGIGRVAFAAGDDELEQVRFTPSANELCLEAISQFSYACETCVVPEANGWLDIFAESFGVDPGRIASAAKWLETATHMAVTPKRVFFTDALGWWSLPVRRGEFPDTARFVAKLAAPDAVLVDMDTAELAEACDRLGIVLPEKSQALLLQVNAGEIILTADGGQGSEILDGVRQVSGPSVKVVIPGRDFGGFVSRAPGNQIRLTLTGTSGPIGVQAVSTTGVPGNVWLGIIMPLATPTPENFCEWEEAA